MLRAAPSRLAKVASKPVKVATRPSITKLSQKSREVMMAMPPIYVYKIEATTDAANVMPAVWQDWYSHRVVDKDIAEAVKRRLTSRARAA